MYAFRPEIGWFELDHPVEQMQIESAPGIALAVNLHLPKDGGGTPFPLALLIPGGGPGGRHTYDFLIDRFVEDGIAVLEYDKRGVWQSTGARDDSLPILIQDAAALLAYLRTRQDIDMARVATLGLCEGALVGSALAFRDGGIAAVIMLSSPVGSGQGLFLRALETALQGAGLDREAIATVAARTRLLMDARSRNALLAEVDAARTRLAAAFVEAGRDGQFAEAALASIDTAESISLWMARPDLELAGLSVPVLAIYGALDVFVPPALHRPAAERALASNPDATIRELPGLNHTFQRVFDRPEAADEDLGAPNSAPEMVQLVGDWLRDRLCPANHASAAGRAAAMLPS